MTAAAEDPNEIAMETAAGPAPTVTSLAPDSSMGDIAAFMAAYKNKSGNKLFEKFAENVEHIDMKSLIAKSAHLAKWADVTCLVFNGDTSTSLVFKQKIETVAEQDRERKRETSKNRRLVQTKEARLAELRANDEVRLGAEEPVVKPVPLPGAFAAQFGMGMPAAAALAAKPTYVRVPWSKDFEADAPDSTGSTNYRRFRDEVPLQEGMCGWALLPEKLPRPPKDAVVPDNPTLHPSFKQARVWMFEVSPVAMQTLADLYKVTLAELRHKKIDHTHFNKVPTPPHQPRTPPWYRHQPTLPCISGASC